MPEVCSVEGPGANGTCGAHDRVHRTSVDAEPATDARCLVDPRDHERPGIAETAVERNDGTAGQCRERRDDRVGAGRAAIDGFTIGDGLGIGPAPLVTAAPALRLRQHAIEPVGKGRRQRRAHGAYLNARREARAIGRIRRRCATGLRAGAVGPTMRIHPDPTSGRSPPR
jgi:hypothetical protein